MGYVHKASPGQSGSGSFSFSEPDEEELCGASPPGPDVHSEAHSCAGTTHSMPVLQADEYKLTDAYSAGDFPELLHLPVPPEVAQNDEVTLTFQYKTAGLNDGASVRLAC